MKNRGQIAIITLFSLVVFVVIGGSIVTQIVFEQRKAVLEEKSRQAYYAAESGIENALQQIMNDESINQSIKVGNAEVTISTELTQGSFTVEAPSLLSSGRHFYLNLDGYLGQELKICWDEPDTGIVATYFYEEATLLKSNTYAFNSGATGSPITNAENSISDSNLCGLEEQVYYVDLTSLPITPKYLLIWVAYQDNVKVAFQAQNNYTFPEQYTSVSSIAQVSENSDQVTRIVEYSVSKVGNTSLTYPPAWLTVPVFAVGGVTYADK